MFSRLFSQVALKYIQRLTRKTDTTLDDQVINVLKGEMSLVGPRPLLMEYLALYTPEQALRHEVRPGITGWAQVNGRNAISWEEKFKLDVLYVDNQSFWLDVKTQTLWAWPCGPSYAGPRWALPKAF